MEANGANEERPVSGLLFDSLCCGAMLRHCILRIASSFAPLCAHYVCVAHLLRSIISFWRSICVRIVVVRSFIGSVILIIFSAVLIAMQFSMSNWHLIAMINSALCPMRSRGPARERHNNASTAYSAVHPARDERINP